MWAPSFVESLPTVRSTELVERSTIPIGRCKTHVYVRSRAIRIVNQHPYRKWNYQLWRAAVQELHHKGEERLNVTFDGVLALDSEPLGRAF
jgi:hypothetical protein